MAAATARGSGLLRGWRRTVESSIDTARHSHERRGRALTERAAPTTRRPAVGTTADRFLTPGERVLRLLDERSGGTRQQEIVRAADWSASTVTRILQDLEAAGHVTRVQFGREKHVYRAGSEPALLRSPFASLDTEPSQHR